MRTDELIVELAHGAGPVRPLATPSVRLARWAVVVVPAAALGALVIGLRADVQIAVHQRMFMALAGVTLFTALFAAAGAFTLSVPGAERSPLLRAVPIVAAFAWASALIFLLEADDNLPPRVLALVHVSCVLEIAAFGVLAGWPLFAMLRRAAPLRLAWSSALASLAATALGATATQFICPVDDPAHHLVGHVAPLLLLSAVGAFAGRRSLDRLRNRAA